MSSDVNQQFSQEKADQLAAGLAARRQARDAEIRRESDKAAWIAGEVAAGRMIQVSPNAYRVTQGWDAGEVFTVNRNAITGDVEQIVPNHGLDVTASGEVALYSSVPAWHGLGHVIPGGISDIDEVLRLGGGAFEVEKRAVRFSFMGEGEDAPSLRTAPDHFVTVRTDTGASLGVVGRRYTPIQNRALFTFLEDLVGEHGVIWESAGTMRGGRRVFVSMRLPESVRVDAEGINDEIVPFVVMLNSHDGGSPVQALVTPWRPVCRNTERFAVRDAHTSWKVRHTAGALDRIQEARRTLGLTVRYYQRWADEETALARTAVTPGDFDRLIADLWPVDDDSTARAQGNADQRRQRLGAMFAAETERVGRTAYAAERAITDYLDHIAPRRPGKSMSEELARATALLEGADDDIKTRAHRRLMLATRR